MLSRFKAGEPATRTNFCKEVMGPHILLNLLIIYCDPASISIYYFPH